MASKALAKRGLKRILQKGRDKLDKSVEDYLQSIYYDLSKPGSYSGVNKLWKSVKMSKGAPPHITKKQVKDWLENQEVYKIHKAPRQHFKTEKIIVGQVDEQWDGDLVVFTQYKRHNKGYAYIALFVDLFSRYVWLEPLKTKGKQEMVSILEKVFSGGRKPSVLRTDQGIEWKNAPVSEYLAKQKVKHFIAYNAYHASYAERCIRTLKSKLFKYFTKNHTYNWITVLDDMTDSINATVHSSTGMAPKDITVENEQEIYERLYLPIELEREKTPIEYSFSVGDKVRLSHARGAFDKAYRETFTQEIFVIASRLPTHPPHYRVKDLNGELVLGSFYEPEMIKADVDDDTVYIIENIIRYRTYNKEKQALVKWAHYSDKFNSWIPVSEIKKYK